MCESVQNSLHRVFAAPGRRRPQRRDLRVALLQGRGHRLLGLLLGLRQIRLRFFAGGGKPLGRQRPGGFGRLAPAALGRLAGLAFRLLGLQLGGAGRKIPVKLKLWRRF